MQEHGASCYSHCCGKVGTICHSTVVPLIRHHRAVQNWQMLNSVTRQRKGSILRCIASLESCWYHRNTNRAVHSDAQKCTAKRCAAQMSELSQHRKTIQEASGAQGERPMNAGDGAESDRQLWTCHRDDEAERRSRTTSSTAAICSSQPTARRQLCRLTTDVVFGGVTLRDGAVVYRHAVGESQRETWVSEPSQVTSSRRFTGPSARLSWWC